MFFNSDDTRKIPAPPMPMGIGVRPLMGKSQISPLLLLLSKRSNVLPVGAGLEAAAVFDVAFMAAINERSGRDILYSRPQVVASGMTPPNTLPT